MMEEKPMRDLQASEDGLQQENPPEDNSTPVDPTPEPEPVRPGHNPWAKDDALKACDDLQEALARLNHTPEAISAERRLKECRQSLIQYNA